MKDKSIVFIFFVVVVFSVAVYAQENIALGKPYTLEPAPAYEHCTDPEDGKQLTDGVYTEGYFWAQKGTVGWSNASPVIITLDLGEVRPIRGLSFNTAAGAAGVEWPTAIRVLLAGENRVFHAAGDLCVLDLVYGSLPQEGYGVHRFRTDALQAHGRYVAVIVESSPFTFVDEIEVYAGDPAWLDTPLAGPEVQDIKAYLTSIRVGDSIKKRLMSDLRAIRELLQDPLPETIRAEITASLDVLASETASFATNAPEDFRAVLPLNSLHARILAVQAQVWRASGRPPIVVWQTDSAWDPLSHIEVPPQNATAAIDIKMMSGEYRAAAFQISNAVDQEAVFQLRIEGVPASCVTVHEVAWTDTYQMRPVAAALPEAAREVDGYRITAPSGLTRQVWFTFHPADMSAGTYEGVITLVKGETKFTIPVALQIYPMHFPDKPSLHCGGWDYVNNGGSYGITPSNRASFIEHLRAHFVDSPWATRGVIPAATFTDGSYAPGDTASFDEWISLWPDAERYCIFASVGGQIGPHKIGDPGFEPVVQAWARFLASHNTWMRL